MIMPELEETFTTNNWAMIKCEPDHIIFKKRTNNYDYFDIQIGEKINISVPLLHCRYQYYTRFNKTALSAAQEYIKKHLINYEIEKKREKDDRLY